MLLYVKFETVVLGNVGRASIDLHIGTMTGRRIGCNGLRESSNCYHDNRMIGKRVPTTPNKRS